MLIHKCKISNHKGFTLVEIIVVLVILAILAAFLVPKLTGFITEAKKTEVLSECRMSASAAQALYSQSFATGETVLIEDIATLADVSGVISNVEANNGALLHLSYSRSPYVCTYCREYATCANHKELYNFVEGGASPDPPEEPDSKNTIDYFYVGGDENYKVNTMGDLEAYENGNYQALPEGTVFYWKGNYYYFRDEQYIPPGSTAAFKEKLLNSHGKKINIDKFTEPSSQTKPGDLKLVNGAVSVYFPYSEYPDAYLDPSFWLPVNIASD